jgi:hypothetical protein
MATPSQMNRLDISSRATSNRMPLIGSSYSGFG